jgi:hypothetical protein
MIEVSLKLNDYHEVALFHDWLQLLEARREMGAIAKQKVAELPDVPPITLEQAIEEVNAEHAPNLQKLAEPEKITNEMLEQAITAYYRKHKLPAAKAILAKYGVERVGEIPAEKRAQALLDMGF